MTRRLVLSYLPITVRAPHAVVAQPRPFYIQAGKAQVLTQLDNEQVGPASDRAEPIDGSEG